MTIKSATFAVAESQAQGLANSMGWPGEVMDNGDGTVTLSPPDAWDDEENPGKVAASKLTGNKDCHVFASMAVPSEGEWMAVVIQGTPALVLIDQGSGEGWLTLQAPADFDVPESVLIPFQQRLTQTETASMDLEQDVELAAGKKKSEVDQLIELRQEYDKLQFSKSKLSVHGKNPTSSRIISAKKGLIEREKEFKDKLKKLVPSGRIPTMESLQNRKMRESGIKPPTKAEKDSASERRMLKSEKDRQTRVATTVKKHGVTESEANTLHRGKYPKSYYKDERDLDEISHKLKNPRLTDEQEAKLEKELKDLRTKFKEKKKKYDAVLKEGREESSVQPDTRTQVLANVSSDPATPAYQEASITGVTPEGHISVAFADGDIGVYQGKFDPAGLMPIAEAAGVEVASFRHHTMVLANVGTAAAPEYAEAEVIGSTEEGHLEVAFADGDVGIYRSLFHPTGILPLGVTAETASVLIEVAARTAMTPEQKLKRAQDLLKLRTLHDKYETNTDALKGKKGPENKAKRDKNNEDKAKLRAKLDKMGVTSLPSKAHLQRTIKQHSDLPTRMRASDKKPAAKVPTNKAARDAAKKKYAPAKEDKGLDMRIKAPGYAERNFGPAAMKRKEERKSLPKATQDKIKKLEAKIEETLTDIHKGSISKRDVQTARDQVKAWKEQVKELSTPAK
ncbi:hypothetical protein SKa4_00006 [Pseudomonas phage vB_PpuM-SKa-4]